MVRQFVEPDAPADYVRREAMIPMRDGVRLFTVLIVPKQAHDAPILLSRTPYGTATALNPRPPALRGKSVVSMVAASEAPFLADGYIRVAQDVRGKFRSEGDFFVTRPRRGPFNPTGTDETTDAWDTIDWLIHNVPESNGRVGMTGGSFLGFTVAAALLDPHPALKAAVPASPMIDGWMGDDWGTNGTFKLDNFDYFLQLANPGGSPVVRRDTSDEYETMLRAGSAGAYAKKAGIDQLPWWRKLAQHRDYDAFWQDQAVDRQLARVKPSVPTLWVGALWDAEDPYGAVHAYAAQKQAGDPGGLVRIVLGPWRHMQHRAEAASLGALKFGEDTALTFRRDVLKPFFDRYLRDVPAPALPKVRVFDTGRNVWQDFEAWPPGCLTGCAGAARRLYLRAGGTLAFDAPQAGEPGQDSYVSDPAKPVPDMPRPIPPVGVTLAGIDWWSWRVADQRFAADRPDVLSYRSEALTKPVHVAGVPVADLFAATTGSDSDWVVKLIDVYPGELPAAPDMAGYQLGVTVQIFRGRYREGFEASRPLEPGAPLRYRFDMTDVDHTFLPGHRIMVQIQSSLFPLYDRNPQTFVPNILFAEPSDFRPATQTILHDPDHPTALLLPVVED